jgi:hypothetical protein
MFYDVMYDGEVQLSYVEEAEVKKFFAEVRKDFDTDREIGYIDADVTFDSEIEYYQVMLYVETEPFL